MPTARKTAGHVAAAATFLIALTAPAIPSMAHEPGLSCKARDAAHCPAKSVAFTQTGTASWYGSDFHGKLTASGDRFDQNALTAAHRALPLGTVVRVTAVDSGKSVEVTINDRGPYIDGRIIDLSRRAAQRLGFLEDGLLKVRLRVIEPATEPAGDSTRTASAGPAKPDDVQVAEITP